MADRDTTATSGIDNQEAVNEAPFGTLVWHCSGEDSGPDVGVSIKLGDTKLLWCGEITRKLHRDTPDCAHLGPDTGWWVILYDGDASWPIAKCVDGDVAREAFESISHAILRTTPAKLNTPDKQEEACRYCGREVLIGNLPGTGFLAVCGRRLAHAEACLPGGCHEAKNTRTLPSNEALAGDDRTGVEDVAPDNLVEWLSGLADYFDSTSWPNRANGLRRAAIRLSRTPSSPQADEADVERDAARWRGLLNCARIRMMGSANLDPKTGAIKNPAEWVHFGAEFWSIYPSFEEAGRPGDSSAWGRAALTALADHVLLMNPALSSLPVSGEVAELRERFREAVEQIPWVAERVRAGQQFNAYERASNDEDAEDEEREYRVGVGPITDFSSFVDVTGRAEAELIEIALKIAALTPQQAAEEGV